MKKDEKPDTENNGAADEAGNPAVKKTGPGFPPVEHRWTPGCPSPNPHGRPRKAAKQKMLEQRLEPFQEMVQRIAGLKTGDGRALQEAAVRKVYELAFDPDNPDLKALALLTQLNATASAAAEKLRADAARAAFDYKVEMSRQLREVPRERVNFRLVVPHPDDIIIGRDLSITIIGPATDEEYSQMLLCLDQRDAVGELLTSYLAMEDEKKRRRKIAWCRRHWKIFDDAVPPRLRKPFPLRRGQLALDAAAAAAAAAVVA